VNRVTLPNVTAEELMRRIEKGDDFVLVDALAPMVYAHSHLPGAINLPPSDIDPTRVARRVPDLQTEIVVYCSSPDCNDSVATARRLQEMGYANVRHYAGGKDEWRDLGLPLERAGKPYVPSDS
jgi:rhodanese-related sulfurtransferase